MTGTFGGALEARKIPASDGRLTAEGVGEVEQEGKVLVIKRIGITYRLRIDADTDRDAVSRAYDSHPQHCPVYRSIHPQIQVTTTLELVE